MVRFDFPVKSQNKDMVRLIWCQLHCRLPKSFVQMKLKTTIDKELKEKKAKRYHHMNPYKALMNKVFRDSFGVIPIPQDLVRSANSNELRCYVSAPLIYSCVYRVSHHVSDLGWVDLDLGCSTTLLGQ